jgi:hypothetical protein
MPRPLVLSLLVLSISCLAAPAAESQEWRPPSREMPAMPSLASLEGDWLTERSRWFENVQAASGVATNQLRAVGERRSGSDRAQIVRFNNGPLPVVVWSDRSGDGRADMIEIYRGGGLIIQLIDADYDGSANVMRVYDPGGRLLREDRL